jgi:K+ transporter
MKKEKIIAIEEEVSVFASKGIPIKTKSTALSGLSENIYIYLSSVSQSATDFYHIPSHKIVEFGARYKI